MSEEPKVEGRTITDELSKLGKQMADAIKAAWESDDRKKLQAEIVEGLQKFGDEVTEALDKAGQSETAKDLRIKAEKVTVDVRESGVVEDVRKGIIGGLDVINKELGKLVEKLEPKTKPADEVPAAAEAPAEPAAPEAPEAPADPRRRSGRCPARSSMRGAASRSDSDRTAETRRAQDLPRFSVSFCRCFWRPAFSYCPAPYLAKKSQVALAVSCRVGLEMPHSSQVGR